MIAWVVALLLATPSDQTVVYYNARAALREGRPTEALKLWLLRNAIESETRELSRHDPDFASVTWAALGELALCPDGFPPDDAGAGVYPIAQHNYLVRTMRRGEGQAMSSAFDAFRFGRHQRHISLLDVLDYDELLNVRFERTPCWLHGVLLWDRLEDFDSDIADRRVTGRLMRYLLRRALKTLDPERVRGRSVIQARLFDLELRLAGLATKAARRAARRARGEAKRAGLTEAELNEAPLVPPDSAAGRVLAAAREWPASEWMALSSKRRTFLFAEATQRAPDTSLAPVILGVIDQLIVERRGAELHGWLAYLGTSPEHRRAAWAGERGRLLLGLDPETGFRERAVIALHRGVDFLERGELPQAVRSFALAMGQAEGSARSVDLRNLSRRWLSFVAARFRVTDDLFVLLKATVPRADYAEVLEDQVWQAAFAADAQSYDRAVRHRVGRGAMVRRVERVAPLARGDAEGFVEAVAADFAEAPSSTMRFVQRFVERLERQPVENRVKLAPVLRRLIGLIQVEDGAPGRARAQQLVDRMRSVLDGVPGADLDPDRALAVDRSVHAGSVRVAPSDELPWPFRAPDPDSPGAFEPITLRPVEWRGDDGEWVFGWQIRD